MDASELDRLGSSVKQIVERLTEVEEDRSKLREEKRELENRLKRQLKDSNRVADFVPQPSITDDQLQELKSRIAKLVKRISDLENSL